MKNIYLYIVITIIWIFSIPSYFIYPQTIEWDRINFGVSGHGVVLTGDFAIYWKNPIGISCIVNYRVAPSLFLDGAFSFTPIHPKNNKENIPDIYFINLPLGLKWYFLQLEKSKLFINSGIENNTFIFKGEAAKKLKDNTTESEFGAFISLGINPGFLNYPDIEVYSKYQMIFSYPEHINIYFIGINVYLNE